jgi:fermentation-respiration switch protein FrsA (DUF1100 family)
MLLLERRFIYFPFREHDARPADFGLRADDLVLWTTDGVRLHGWWIHAGTQEGGIEDRTSAIRNRGSGVRGQEPEAAGQGPEAEKLAIIWYHGNAGNVSHRLDIANEFVNRYGADILLLDYRGYGLSEGRPEEAGMYQDGEAAYAEARRRGFAPEAIVLYGESIGSAVAIEMALRHPCGGIILQSPFLSIPALARSIYKILPTFLIRTQLDNAVKIGRVTAPKLILQGDRDEVVPLSHGRRLFELAAPPKRFVILPGARHNDTYLAAGGAAYFDAVRAFLAEVTATARLGGQPIG